MSGVQGLNVDVLGMTFQDKNVKSIEVEKLESESFMKVEEKPLNKMASHFKVTSTSSWPRSKLEDAAEREENNSMTSLQIPPLNSMDSTIGSEFFRPSENIKAKATALPWEDHLKYFGIYDVATTFCMFQHVWRWSDDGHKEAIGSLVQSFWQFAREIDNGEVAYVNFEKPVANDQSNSNYETIRSLESLKTHFPGGNKSTAQDAIQMVGARNEQCFVVIFFDIYETGHKTNALLRARAKHLIDMALERTREVYRSNDENLQELLAPLVSSESVDIDMDHISDKVQPMFKAFTEILKDLIAKVTNDNPLDAAY